MIMSLNQKYMSRGGHRDNAGRKSGWNNGETQTIRVPKAYASQLLEIAKRLDNGEALESVTKSNSQLLESVTESMSEFLQSLEGKSGGNQYKGKGEVRADGVRWYFFNKYKDWVKAKATQIQEGG